MLSISLYAVSRSSDSSDRQFFIKATVATEKAALHSLQNKADKTELEINAPLKSPAFGTKIEEITHGILKKNHLSLSKYFHCAHKKTGSSGRKKNS